MQRFVKARPQAFGRRQRRPGDAGLAGDFARDRRFRARNGPLRLGEKSISETIDNPRVGIHKCCGGIDQCVDLNEAQRLTTQVWETARIDQFRFP
jgi:hypothetical protein